MNLQAKFGEQEMKVNAPFKSITVVEGVKPVYQEKTVTPSTVEQEVIPDDGYTALSKATVKAIPSEYVVPSGEFEITENGSFDVKDYASAKVNVQSGDTLKTLLDATKSAYYLFSSYKGTSVEGLIPYNATENVTNMGNMFYNCPNLTEVTPLATSNVTDMGNMFNSCPKLTKVPLLDTSNVTRMERMFSNDSILAEVPLFDTSKVTDMTAMFYNCYKLTSVPSFDTSNVTKMNNMFTFCEVLTRVPMFNTGNVANMSSMFSTCRALKEVPQLDTKNVTDINSMFTGCRNITEVVLSDISKATSLSSMFYSCYSLKKVVLGQISSKVRSSSSWFYDCKALEVIHFKDATSIPTLSATNAFYSVPSTCKVVIPDALYDSWTTATNWSAINVTWTKESEYDDATGGGEELVPTEGLAYKILSDGTGAALSGIGTATDTDIVIASEYEGLPVKMSYQDALASTNITSAVVPVTFETLQNYTFCNCPNLVSVKILAPCLVRLYCFSSSSNLKRVDFSKCNAVATLENKNAFNNTHADLQIKVPANLIDEWKAATNWSNFADKIVTEFTNEL